MEYARAMEEYLRDRFRHKALAPDTLFLLSPNDALMFLEEAVALDLTIAGVEGFVVTDTGAYQLRQVFSNDIADFSGRTDKFLQETRDLIRRGAISGLCFQVVLDQSGL